MEANLRSGEVNMTSSSGFQFDQALLFEKKVKTEKLPYEVIFTPAVVYSHLDFNLEHEILKDLKVRKALSFSFNKKEMIQAFFEGKLKPAYHFSTPFDSWYTDDPKKISIYEYDKKKATALLDEAGWKIGEGGYRYKNGKKLTFTISSATDNKTTDMIEVYLQDTWKKIGVDLQIKNYPSRVFFPEIVKKRKYDLAFYSFISSPDNSQKSILHSTMIPTESNSWAGANRPGWKNLQVDQWLDQVDREFNAGKRNSLMQKVLKAYTDEVPVIPVYYKANNSVIPSGMKNFRQSGHIFTEYLEIENWSK
jgi:peptide/nickel transport system substrate-binding protein